MVLVFCTAYTEYAFEAVSMYAKGYLMKPVSAENIVRTLDEMVYDWRKSREVQENGFWIKTFGNFEVFDGWWFCSVALPVAPHTIALPPLTGGGHV
jgi:two-component SAPR family response regulator